MVCTKPKNNEIIAIYNLVVLIAQKNVFFAQNNYKNLPYLSFSLKN